MENKRNKVLSYIGIIAGACLLYAASAGLRSVSGILLGAISSATGFPYASVSLVIAIGQLAFGAAQPIFGVVALKRSNAFVLTMGCVSMAIGLAAIPFCKTEWMLTLFLGVLLSIGTGAVSFGILMGAITPKLGERRAAAASGFVNASSGVGSIVFSPMIQTLFSSVGLKATMLGLGTLAILLVPVALFAGGSKVRNHIESGVLKRRMYLRR